jgi:hypothetical protein
MATEAATAYATANGLPASDLNQTTCNGHNVEQVVSANACVTWCYSGSCAGYYRTSGSSTCNCPSSGNHTGTWD